MTLSAMQLTPVPRLAARLGVSEAAVELARASELVDMHVESFLPMRLYGYDFRARHDLGWLRGWLFGHFDVPRALDGGAKGAAFSITTNPFRTAKGRWEAFLANLERLRDVVASSSGALRIVRTRKEYDEARARGAIACMPAVQGANCLEGSLVGPRAIPDRLLTRATLVHLTSSRLGATSSPFGGFWRSSHVTARGRALVEQLNEERIFVDLAHAHPNTFWDVVDVHDRTLPLLVTHTGVQAVSPSWRNLDDDQLRAVADTGGVVGIISATYFLKARGRKNTCRLVIDHLEHAISVAGEEHVGIGTDWDGFIIPPPDLRSAESYVRLVQHMLDAGWTEQRVRRVLGENYLRAFGELRP